ncbi:unnamed protein product [Schistosoma turkestanicum]|nr:unnamed protein product [Schistosoma turkestanicum]
MALHTAVFVLVCFILHTNFVSSDCIWYGICNFSDPAHPRYCSYNGTAKALSNDGLKILSSLCPNYAVGSAKVCCNEEQLTYFSNSASLAAALLKRCPACFANFRLLFCAMTCDPNQAEFITPVIQEKLVDSITYTLTDHVADTFFNSCKDVTFGNGRAISLMCGTDKCTRQLLLDNIGKSTDGGQSPFDIRFNVVPSVNLSMYTNSSSTIRPFDTIVYQCNQRVPKRADDVGGPACSCMDCSSACSSGPPDLPPQPSEPIEIFGISVWLFSGYIIFSILTIIFGTYQIAKLVVYGQNHVTTTTTPTTNRSRCCTRTSQSDTEHLIRQPEEIQHERSQPEGRICLLAYLTAYFDKIMTKMFSSHGRMIARHPLMVLLISLGIILALAGGLAFLQVTTNPVELWSGEESRSRLEKNYFDQQFGAFYRIEQIILRPKNTSNFTHKALGDASGDALFGAGLNKTFLLRAVDLQNRIQSIEVYYEAENKSIHLSDLCFQPLKPDNHGCAITSPIEYFQNNMTLFNTVRNDDFGQLINDYLDHLLFCTEAPLSTSGSPLDPTAGCLSSSGMPVLPQVAFGSFNASFYNGSVAVVLTFLLNNNPDPKSIQVQKAKLWESKYLQLIHEWKLNNTEIIVSFSAERSVEDEIERQSNSDISTIAISYMVMFVYVSLFLGTYRSCKTILIDMRITLGFAGILIVLASVLASVGFWSYFKLPITLIIVEVIPFLVLAIGVDNIFILVHEFEYGGGDRRRRNESSTLITNINLLKPYLHRLNCDEKHFKTETLYDSNGGGGDSMLNLTQNEQQPDQLKHLNEAIKLLVEDRIAESVGNVGPSILLTGLAESVAFFCGALTTMPAVRVFALYAAMAIVFNFLLQIFAFIALLTLDGRRYVARRFDVLYCLKLHHEFDQLKQTIQQSNLSNSNNNNNNNNNNNYPTLTNHTNQNNLTATSATTNQNHRKLLASDNDSSLSLSSTAMDDMDENIHEIDLAESRPQRSEINKNIDDDDDDGDDGDNNYNLWLGGYNHLHESLHNNNTNTTNNSNVKSIKFGLLFIIPLDNFSTKTSMLLASWPKMYIFKQYLKKFINDNDFYTKLSDWPIHLSLLNIDNDEAVKISSQGSIVSSLLITCLTYFGELRIYRSNIQNASKYNCLLKFKLSQHYSTLYGNSFQPVPIIQQIGCCIIHHCKENKINNNSNCHSSSSSSSTAALFILCLLDSQICIVKIHISSNFILKFERVVLMSAEQQKPIYTGVILPEICGSHVWLSQNDGKLLCYTWDDSEFGIHSSSTTTSSTSSSSPSCLKLHSYWFVPSLFNSKSPVVTHFLIGNSIGTDNRQECLSSEVDQSEHVCVWTYLEPE